MSKMIVVVDVPNDCYEVVADITAESDEEIKIHNLYYNTDEIEIRRRAFDIFNNQLKNMGIE